MVIKKSNGSTISNKEMVQTGHNKEEEVNKDKPAASIYT